MNLIKAFFEGVPAACMVQKDIAEIEGTRNGSIYVFEVQNSGEILARKFGQTSRQRLARAFDGWRDLADADILEYAERFASFIDMVSRFNSKGIGDLKIIDAEAAALRTLEPSFPTVSALMTVDQAIVQGNWG